MKYRRIYNKDGCYFNIAERSKHLLIEHVDHAKFSEQQVARM